MKSLITTMLLMALFCMAFSQAPKQGSVINQKFLAPSIQNNPGGEDANRRLSIYLPPGYEKSKARYPVIYFLHGFAVQDNEMMEWIGFKNLMDSAINGGHLRPSIVVLPNSMTKSTWPGSWLFLCCPGYISGKF